MIAFVQSNIGGVRNACVRRDRGSTVVEGSSSNGKRNGYEGSLDKNGLHPNSRSVETTTHMRERGMKMRLT